MTTEVYGISYSKKQPADILRRAMQLDAVVFDVRLSPRSRRPEWNKGRLQDAMGDRYQHVPEFGNINYKGGPVKIQDFDAGEALVRQSPKPVILMCVCSDPAKCHRTVVGKMLALRGMTFTELDDPKLRRTAEGRQISQMPLL
jgi:uncharacterized protein (DUF488 family)